MCYNNNKKHVMRLFRAQRRIIWKIIRGIIFEIIWGIIWAIIFNIMGITLTQWASDFHNGNRIEISYLASDDHNNVNITIYTRPLGGPMAASPSVRASIVAAGRPARHLAGRTGISGWPARHKIWV